MGNQAAILKKFPYEIGESYAETFLWKLHHGKKKATQENVTIFAFEINDKTKDRLDLARNSFKRLKSIRHPSVIKFLDGVELQTHIYVVTEYVQPLAESLRSMFVEIGYNEAISWGLYQVLQGLEFLHSRRMAHGAISIHSIFMDAAGDWKIGELGFLTESTVVNPNDPNGQEYAITDFAMRTFSHHLPHKYKAPEIMANRWDIVEKLTHKVDSWGVACLISEVFEGQLNSTHDLKRVTTKIPKAIEYSYNQLLLDDPTYRGGINEMLQLPYFNNNMIKTQIFLENMSLKDPVSVETFLTQLPEMLSGLPKKNCKFRILPQLINAIKYGSGGSKAIIPIFQIGEMMTQEEFKDEFIPKILDLFESSDRTVRVNLLKNLNTIMPHLTTEHVEQRVYPHVSKGFRDSSPVLREMTVKSMIDIVPKLTETTVSENVIRFLWALQGDKEPAIRTNTIIALGKLARNFSEKTRKRILLSAFARSLKDPFVHSRTACLKALISTKDLYTPAELATKALPAVVALTVDPSKPVRDLAFQCTNTFLDVISAASNSPNFEAVAGIDPAVASMETATDNNSSNATQYSQQSGVSSASAQSTDDPGYLGWAVSSVSSLKSKIVGEKTNIGADIKKPVQSTQPVSNQTSTTGSYGATSNAPISTGNSYGTVAVNKPSTDMFADSQMVVKQHEPVQKLQLSKSKSPKDDIFGDFEIPQTAPKKPASQLIQPTQPKSTGLNITPYNQQTAFNMPSSTQPTAKQSQPTTLANPKKATVNTGNQMNTDNDFNFNGWDEMISMKPAKSEDDFFNSVMNDDDIFGLGPPKQKSPSQPKQSSLQTRPATSTKTNTLAPQKSDLMNFAPPPTRSTQKSTTTSTTAKQTQPQQTANVPNNRMAKNRQNTEDGWGDFDWGDMPSGK